MRTVRHKLHRNEVDVACENILRIALNPNQINDTFTAIREVNAAFSGMFSDWVLITTKKQLKFLEKFELEDRKNHRNSKKKFDLLETNEQKDHDLFSSAFSASLTTVIFLAKSKIMAFIIYHFEKGIRRFLGYSFFVFCFFSLAFYIFVAFFIIEYVTQIYLLLFAPMDGKYDSITTLHTFAEILEQEDILISVRNLYNSEPNYGIEFYPILEANPFFLKSDQTPQTVPEMLSMYKKYGPGSTPERPRARPPHAVTLMAPLARLKSKYLHN